MEGIPLLWEYVLNREEYRIGDGKEVKKIRQQTDANTFFWSPLRREKYWYELYLGRRCGAGLAVVSVTKVEGVTRVCPTSKIEVVPLDSSQSSSTFPASFTFHPDST